MKTLVALLSLGAVLAAPSLANARILRTVEKTFNVKEGGVLRVETSGGDIKVVSGEGTEVKVTATEDIDAKTDAKANDLLADLELTIVQQGDGVTAKAKYGKSGWHFGRVPVQVSFTVVVPHRYNVELKTSGGDVGVENLSGRAVLRTSGGDIKLARIDGDVDGETSGGDIHLNEGTATVKLSTSGGDILVDRAGGPADLSTSGGDIRIASVKGRVHASTSGGNVSASIDGAVTGDCELSTSGGSVEVTVDKTAAFNLDAHTSGGDVEAEGLTISIDKGGIGSSKLAGKVNGGGARVVLESSGGDVRVRMK